MTEPPTPKIPYMQILLGGFILVFALLLLYVVLSANPGGRPLILGLTLLGILGLAMGLQPLLRLMEARQSISLREQRFSDSLRLSQDLLLEWDARREGLLVVEAESPFLGHTPADLQKLTLVKAVSLVHPDDFPIALAKLDPILSAAPEGSVGREPVQEDILRIKTPRGDWRWCRIRWEVLERGPGGSARRIAAAAWDVTDQRRCEAALIQAQRFESLGVLAGSIAHEFNNVLMGIQGFTELAIESRDPDDRTANLERILEGTDRASHLCRQMLAYAGRGKRQIVQHQVNDSVRETQPLIERMLPTNVALKLQLESDLPPVMADPNQIRHALLNLVVNAADAIGGDAGEVVVRTQLKHLVKVPVGAGDLPRRELTGDYVCLEVQDTGRGMSEETLSSIFDPFFSTRTPGRGLGLPTVLGIAKGHHGSIRVASAPGEGSCFTLYFPVAESHKAAEPSSEPEELPLWPEGSHKGEILLVEDESTIRSVMRQGFERVGFSVIEAADGVDGFGAFVRHRNTLTAVLLDLTMPRMGGRELFEEIHKLSPETPVILMSGYSEQDALKDMEHSGLAGFLPKPCSMKEAVAAIQKALAAARPGS